MHCSEKSKEKYICMMKKESTFYLEPFVHHNKNFIFQGKKYPVDFNIIQHNSNYFYKCANQYKSIEDIEIPDQPINISEESFQTFISACQNEFFEIKDSNIIELHHLSISFDVPKLTWQTNEYIKTHNEDLVFKLIQYKIHLNKENRAIDLANEEIMIASHFFKYVNNSNLAQLPIPNIYRIINIVKMQINQMDNFKQSQFIEFMFKCLDMHKKEASVLFLNLNLKNKQTEIIWRLITKYSNIFDFQMIDHNLLINEIKKLNDSNIELKQKLQVTLKDLENVKKKAHNDIDNTQIQKKSDEKKKNEIIPYVKEDLSEKTIRDMKIGQYNTYSIKSQQIIANKISKFSICPAKYFYTKIDNLCMYLLRVNYLNMPAFKILSDHDEYISDLQKECQIKLRYTLVENLFEKNLLNSNEFVSIVSNFNCLHIEIRYPHPLFQRIYDQILLIKRTLINETKLGVYISGVSEIGPVFKEDKKISFCECDSALISIEDYAFSECSSLIWFKIPSSVTAIRKGCFSNCSSLQYISLPSSLISIEDNAFCGCSSLYQISIPSSITEIKKYAFSKCSSLTNILIPSSIKSIGICAFNECSSLRTLSLPSSVTSVGQNAFYKCRSLKQISVFLSVWAIYYEFPQNIKVKWRCNAKQIFILEFITIIFYKFLKFISDQ